jgi:hypothetical protein
LLCFTRCEMVDDDDDDGDEHQTCIILLSSEWSTRREKFNKVIYNAIDLSLTHSHIWSCIDGRQMIIHVCQILLSYSFASNGIKREINGHIHFALNYVRAPFTLRASVFQ